MSKEQDSDSIFTSATQHDVRHDIATVHEKWSQERQRRRKRALLVLVPLFTFLIVGYVLLAYTCTWVPGYYSFHPYGSEVHRHDETPVAAASSSLGYPQAKLQMRLLADQSDREIRELLLEAVESKPSEIHLQLLRSQDLSFEEQQSLKEHAFPLLSINGSSKLSLTRFGKTRKLDVSGPAEFSYTRTDLALAIMQLHEELYGASQHPVFQPKDENGKPISLEAFEQLEKRRKQHLEAMEKEQAGKQTLKNLPNVMPAPTEKH